MLSLTRQKDVNEAWIIGGGPSLHDFDFTRLKNKFTIGCNRAAFDAGTDVVFSIDRNFMKQYREDMSRFDGLVYLAPRKWTDYLDHPYAVQKYIWNRSSDLSHAPPYIQGLHTGQGALNFAVLEGFTEIHILGIDLNQQGHWHHGYGGRQSLTSMQRWAYDMDMLKPDLDAMGVKVFNYSPDSAVRAYPFKNLEEIQ